MSMHMRACAVAVAVAALISVASSCHSNVVAVHPVRMQKLQLQNLWPACARRSCLPACLPNWPAPHHVRTFPSSHKLHGPQFAPRIFAPWWRLAAATERQVCGAAAIRCLHA